ncbi:type I methionyl aminopeptidase [Patescibacteria group bacterium]|nr:type I methionyl aminopeptidase [Candidatus Falkowbacteria bacterium]MBU3905418.1 type I methionyl aminopeptidase [Patescibacteria group bacterium]MBU4014822.1 type I methionyl aminopeptidase [Patescibacteria group bacterium]MBU4027128.1 type I methionyl aminopeptidase [Patescibacteria group bacterium]MBU4073354.1 type I methionyl aminopeptidase [Patescibacteria group bacterium]
MIIIKTKKEIEIMRKGGKILAEIMDKLAKEIAPGVSTEHLENMACELIGKAGGRPSFKGYKSKRNAQAFPTALCISINNEVVHAPALPSRELKSGDIAGLDLGMEHPYYAKASYGKPAREKFFASGFANKDSEMGGYFTDMAITVPVGKISKQASKLINTTKKSLELAIKQVKPGNTLSDIGGAIQDFAESNGFSVVRELVGHGVGTAVHEDPQVPNYKIVDDSFENVILKPGMAIAIEPMVNAGGWKIKTGKDGLAILTADGKLSAHFEHTVVVTEKGRDVLTIA